MNRLGRKVESWVLATTEFVLAFVGATAVFYPTLSLAASLAGAPFAGLIPLVAFSLSFGATYPLIAGDWPIARLYDVLLVAVCCTVLASVALAGVAGATNPSPIWTRPSQVTELWVLSLGVASLAVSGFDLRLLA